MTRIRLFLFSDPPSLAFMPIFPAPPPACASSLPDSLCFDSWFNKTSSAFSSRSFLPYPFYALVFCNTDYSNKSVVLSICFEFNMCLLMLLSPGHQGNCAYCTHLVPPLQEPFILLRLFLLQAIFGCK